MQTLMDLSTTTGVRNDARLLSIPDFCRAHSISRGMLYKLLGQGEGPATVKVGRRTLISAEAAHAWRQGLGRKTAGRGAKREAEAA